MPAHSLAEVSLLYQAQASAELGSHSPHPLPFTIKRTNSNETDNDPSCSAQPANLHQLSGQYSPALFVIRYPICRFNDKGTRHENCIVTAALTHLA